MIKKLKNKINKNKGFTIIELLIVIAIIAILASFSASSFVNNISDYRLNAAARELVSNMHKARNEAIKTNNECAIYFNYSNSTYSICINDSDENWNTNTDNTCIDSIKLTDYKSSITYGHGSATNPKGTTFGTNNITYTPTSPKKRLVFNSKGTCNSGYIYIENGSDDTFAIGTLSSGLIVMYKWKQNQWIE